MKRNCSSAFLEQQHALVPSSLPNSKKTMARKFFVGGNWKSNGTVEEVKKIVTTLNEAEVPSEDVVEVVISPPFVFLPLVKTLLRCDFSIAAQNCWVRKGGAFTGEIRYAAFFDFLLLYLLKLQLEIYASIL